MAADHQQYPDEKSTKLSRLSVSTPYSAKIESLLSSRFAIVIIEHTPKAFVAQKMEGLDYIAHFTNKLSVILFNNNIIGFVRIFAPHKLIQMWFLMVPIDEGFSVSIAWVSMKNHVPRFKEVFVMTGHALARMKQAQVSHVGELEPMVGRLIASLADATFPARTDLLAELLSDLKAPLELLTPTGRLRLALVNDVVTAVTWIADKWSSPARQGFITKARERGDLFLTL